MVRVKICGITSLRDAWDAVDAGADALGFVFATESPRYVSPAECRAITKTLPAFISTVGVFVDEKPSIVRSIRKECGLGYVQLHGSEGEDYASRFPGSVIKAFRVRSRREIMRASGYPAAVVLFDSFAPRKSGGTGRRIDLRLFEGIRIPVPFMLAGGLTPANVRSAVRMVRPYGVDASSGVERSPGIKDAAMIRSFIRAAKGLR